MKSKLIKVWIDAHQYRIFDACDCPTIALLRAALASKLDVDPNSCDLILESGLIEKTTRKLAEKENVEKVSKKKGIHRIMWVAIGDAGISGPTAVKHEGHIGVGAKGIEYRNLPPHWMTIFQALDEKLKSMGEGAITQTEVQYLIKECASVLLAIPSATPAVHSPPSSPATPHAPSHASPKLRRFSRPKSTDVPAKIIAQNDAREIAIQHLEVEVVKLKADKILLEEEISVLKEQIQSEKDEKAVTAMMPRLPSVSTQKAISELREQLSFLQQQFLAEQQSAHALRDANTKLQAQVEVLTSSLQRVQTTPAPAPPSASAPSPRLPSSPSVASLPSLPPPPLPPPPPPPSASKISTAKEPKGNIQPKQIPPENSRDQLLQAIREGKRLRASTAPPLMTPVKQPATTDSNSVVNILAKVLLDRRKHLQDEKDEKEKDDDNGEWD